MSNLKWAGSKNLLSKMSGDNVFETIGPGIWNLIVTMTGAYLEKSADTFHFKHKLYNVDDQFIDHTLKTYENVTKNMGVLLNGIKGSGKTVTAKRLANASNLPVIMMDHNSIENISFFEDIEQPLCFFFDEFEKNLKTDADPATIAKLLTFVDGTNLSKHLMLFTSNEMKISPYFIDRPGRIRYIKNYHSLPFSVIMEVIDDMLIYKEYKSDLLHWAKYFRFLTMDMLTSIIQEINIHNCPPAFFKSFFNVDNEKNSYQIKWKVTHLASGKTGEFDGVYIMDNLSPDDYFRNIENDDTYLRVIGFGIETDAEKRVMRIHDTYAREKMIHAVYPLNDNEKVEGKFMIRASLNDMGSGRKSAKLLALDDLYNTSVSESENTSSLEKSASERYLAIANDDQNFILYDREMYLFEMQVEIRQNFSSFNNVF